MNERSAPRSETILAVVLRLSGICLLTAIIPAVMPFSWMQEIHRQLGMGELPTEPIVGYLTRSLSGLYALHGALVLFLSLDVRRFLPVIKCFAGLGVVFGVGMVVLDAAVGMPLPWSICEGTSVVLLSLFLLWLSRRVV
jgi:hypothetical protein